jgi:hypothetical protein
MRVIRHSLFHLFIRWGLAGHGLLHVVETGFNIYEGAWISAAISAFVGFLMISGACIDLTHHDEEQNEDR